MADVKDYPPYLDYPKERKKQTNADRIRAMSDEDLAEFITYAVYDFGEERPGMCDVCDTVTMHHCGMCWLDWLKQEVSE